MRAVRFSAVEMFGIPLKEPDNLDPRILQGLMSAYSITSQEVPEDPTDITPYYWSDAPSRYFLSKATPPNLAVVEWMPKRTNSTTKVEVMAGSVAIASYEAPIRALYIPTNVENFAITGESPRFAGQTCLHELITLI